MRGWIYYEKYNDTTSPFNPIAVSYSGRRIEPSGRYQDLKSQKVQLLGFFLVGCFAWHCKRPLFYPPWRRALALPVIARSVCFIRHCEERSDEAISSRGIVKFRKIAAPSARNDSFFRKIAAPSACNDGFFRETAEPLRSQWRLF